MTFLSALTKKASSLTKYPTTYWKQQERVTSPGTTHSRPVLACLFAQADQSKDWRHPCQTFPELDQPDRYRRTDRGMSSPQNWNDFTIP